MISRHTKFEMSAITCNGGMKGNAKYVKILVLRHPLGDLGVTHTGFIYGSMESALSTSY